MTKLLAPFVFLASLFTTPTTPYTRLVSTVSESVVRLTHTEDFDTPYGREDGEAVCTGGVIFAHIILTAYHCVAERTGPIYIDGAVGVLVKADPEFDLALVSAPTNKPVLGPSPDLVERGQILVAFGYAEGKTTLTVFPVQALYVLLGIIVHPQYLGGMSGGPVVDGSGRMVGIIQKGGQGMGMGADVTTINQFLSE